MITAIKILPSPIHRTSQAPFYYQQAVWRIVFIGEVYIRLQDNRGNNKLVTHEQYRGMQLGIPMKELK